MRKRIHLKIHSFPKIGHYGWNFWEHKTFQKTINDGTELKKDSFFIRNPIQPSPTHALFCPGGCPLPISLSPSLFYMHCTWCCDAKWLLTLCFCCCLSVATATFAAWQLANRTDHLLQSPMIWQAIGPLTLAPIKARHPPSELMQMNHLFRMSTSLEKTSKIAFLMKLSPPKQQKTVVFVCSLVVGQLLH